MFILNFLEHAHKRNVGETDEVGSISKKTTASKKTNTSQKKGENASVMSESGMSSIKKRLEYMQDKPPKKLSKKGAKDTNVPERSTNLAGKFFA